MQTTNSHLYCKKTCLLYAIFGCVLYGTAQATAKKIPSGLDVAVEVVLNDLSIAPIHAQQNAVITFSTDNSQETTTINGLVATQGNMPFSGNMLATEDVLSIHNKLQGTGIDSAAGLLEEVYIHLGNATTDSNYQIVFNLSHQISLNANGSDTITDANIISDVTQHLIQHTDAYFNDHPVALNTQEQFIVALIPGEQRSIRLQIDLQGDTNLFSASSHSDAFFSESTTSIALVSVVADAIPDSSAMPIPTLSTWGLLILMLILLITTSLKRLRH